MMRRILFLTLVVLLLAVPIANAGFVLQSSYPWVTWSDVDASDWSSLGQDMQRLYAEDIRTGSGNAVTDTEATTFLNAVYQARYGDVVDTGIDTTQSLSLDWRKYSLNERCLGINLTRDPFLVSRDVYVVLQDTDYDVTRISSSLSRKVVTTSSYSEVQSTCTDGATRTLTNGSTYTTQVCTNSTFTESRTTESWDPVNIDSYGSDRAHVDIFSHSEPEYYEYCFNAEPTDTNGWGNKGTVYVVYASTTYVDRQHSSYWNLSFPYRRPISIQNNDASNVLKKWSTIRVSGWDTTDTTRYNLTNPHNFEVACHNESQTDVVVDKRVGNMTELTSDANTKLFPDATGWGTTNTTFLFKLPQNISTSTTNNTMCYIYYGILDFRSSSNNMSELALFYDDFNRSDSATLGNNWVEPAANYLQIVSGSVKDVGTNNGVANSNLDVGTCNDCDKYEIRFQQSLGGAAGSGLGVSFSSASDTTGSMCSTGSGICTRKADEGGQDFLIATTTAGTTVKDQGLYDTGTDNFTLITRALDDHTRGDYMGWFNTTYMTWGTTNNTDTETGARSNVKIIANRIDNAMHYLWIERWIDTPPTVTVGAEATNASPGNTVPTHNTPLVNVSNTYNTTFGNVTAWNLTTADTDNESVKNVYHWRYNNTELYTVMMPFEGGSNDTFARDYTTPSNNGTVLGAKFVNQTGSGGYDGFGAYVFDGINDQITVDDKFDMTTATHPFYISSWIYTNITTGEHNILFRYGDSGGANRIILRTVGSDIQFSIVNAGTSTNVTGTANLTANRWTHVAGRYNESMMYLFVNGRLEGRTSVTDYRLNNVSTNDWGIGGNPNSATDNPFNGTIDEVAIIFNYTITNNQIALFYRNATNTTHSDLTERNQTWSGYITPNDRRGDGITKYANVTINRLPVISGLALNSTNPLNYTNGTVFVNMSLFTVTDDDGNSPITNRTTWYRNTTIVAAWDNFTSIVNSSANFSKGYNLTVVMSAFDGAEYGNNATATIIIRNAPPEINSSRITSDLSTNSTLANLTGVWGQFDLDGDGFTANATKWYVNSVRNTTLDNRTRINATETVRQDTFIFSIQTFDGENWSDWINSSAFTVLNSIPSVPNRVPFSNISIYEISYGVNCSGSTDDDSDTIQYEFWLGNLSSGDWQIRQNTTATNYTFTFGANYTTSFNCRANDAINVSAFNATNVTIEFNNTVLSQQLPIHAAEIGAGQNYTYRLNLSFNGIRVSGVYANISYNGQNYTPLRVNDTTFNVTTFNISLFVPFTSLSNSNVTFVWYARVVDQNNSVTQFVINTYQNLTALTLTTAGCTGTSNATEWTIWNITLADEINETALNSSIEASIFLYPIGSDRSLNGTFNLDIASVNQTFVCLRGVNRTEPYGSYGIFHYARTGFNPRQYYLVNTTVDNVTDNIRFYLLETSLATGISFLVQDETETPLSQRYIFVDRYDPGNNSYKTVAMGLTDNAGLDYIFLRQFDAFYRLRIQEDVRTVFLSTPRKITTSSLTITITSGTVFDQLQATELVDYNLSYTNSTNQFQVLFVHKDPKVTSSCLEVYMYSLQNSTSRMCNTCVNASSGTLTCDIGNTTSGTYAATYYVRTNQFDRQIASLQFSRRITSTLTSLLGRSGVLLTVILVGTITFAGLWSPAASVILFVIAIGAAGLMGLLNIGFAAWITLALLAGFLVSRLKK